MSEKSRKIICQLTLEEKCRLCAQDAGSFGRVERLGLAGSVPQDNPRGGEDYFMSGASQDGDGKYDAAGVVCEQPEVPEAAPR